MTQEISALERRLEAQSQLQELTRKVTELQSTHQHDTQRLESARRRQTVFLWFFYPPVAFFFSDDFVPVHVVRGTDTFFPRAMLCCLCLSPRNDFRSWQKSGIVSGARRN